MQDDYSTDITYWSERTADIDKVISSTRDILLLLHNSVEFVDMIGFFNKLPADDMVYVSITKTYDSFNRYLPKLKARTSVIDCITSSVFSRKDAGDCIYLKTPSNLHETTEVIKKAIEDKPDYIVIDSLSQFIDFSALSPEQESLFLFSKNLKDLLRDKGSKAVLLYDCNVTKQIANLPRNYIDNIIKMDVTKSKVYWQG